jgi:hypothetical protein
MQVHLLLFASTRRDQVFARLTTKNAEYELVEPHFERQSAREARNEGILCTHFFTRSPHFYVPFSLFCLFIHGSVAYFFPTLQSTATYLVVFSWLPWLFSNVEEDI